MIEFFTFVAFYAGRINSFFSEYEIKINTCSSAFLPVNENNVTPAQVFYSVNIKGIACCNHKAQLSFGQVDQKNFYLRQITLYIRNIIEATIRIKQVQASQMGLAPFYSYYPTHTSNMCRRKSITASLLLKVIVENIETQIMTSQTGNGIFNFLDRAP